MDRTERLYKIDLLLNEQPGISFATLQDRLEVSRATLKRDLAYMKERLNAPIVFDRFVGGYRFDKSSTPVGDQYELPGLWFSAEEIHALLTMQHLLANLDTGGLLGPHIQPLLARLTALLGTGNNAAEAIQQQLAGQGLATTDGCSVGASIGIDVGDILLIRETDFFGDAVNIASRLGEDLAARGEILVSERAWAAAGKPPGYEAAEYVVSGLPIPVFRRRFT